MYCYMAQATFEDWRATLTSSYAVLLRVGFTERFLSPGNR